MSRANSPRTPPRRGGPPVPGRGPGRDVPREWAWVAVLLTLHLVLVLWGVLRNSVTFDENFHVPAGVAIVTHGDLRVSVVNPPLVKALFGAAALAAGARPPAEGAERAAVATGDPSVLGESFQRRNADRYQRVFVAARLVVVLLSLLLGLLVWRVARRLYGPRAGLLALGFHACAPETLAHAGLATMDLATAISWLASVYAWWMFARTGRWRWWWGAAGAVSCAFLVRFSAPLLALVLAAIAALEQTRRRLRRPARAWLGLALLAPVVIVALYLGYLGGVSLGPLSRWHFVSPPMLALQRHLPGLRLPLPNLWILGFDAQSSDAAHTPCYLLGRILPHGVWTYFPLAMLFKWPLGFLGALLARARVALAKGRRRGAFLAVPVLLYLGGGMFVAQVDAGIRYMYPILPFLCVWLGGLASLRLPAALRGSRGLWLRVGLALVLLQGIEAGLAAPWYLSFFNWPSGGPGGGYRLVNDSNVDWGQGLIALKDEMRRRGIRRIHLAYHGTADPAIYGIDYVPYLGGEPGPESDWLAISSYYFVGLSQRMMTPQGRTDGRVTLDVHALWERRPEARLGGSIYLFPLRGAGLTR